MRTDTERLLNKLSTVTACLCGEARVHSYDLMTSPCSLLFKDVEERTPGGVQNGFRQVMVFHQSGDLKVFHGNTLIAFRIGLRCLEVLISTLTIDLQMRLGDIAGSFAKPVTFLFTAGKRALLASEDLLRRAIETWISNGMAFAISQEGLETDIHADIRMRTCGWGMFSLWVSLADNQRIPMPIGSEYQVNRFRRAFHRAVQLDLEEVTELLGHHKVFLILMQINIFAILSKLDAMPPVRLLEAGEAALLAQFFHGKKAFQRFGEPVSKHLNRGGRDMFFALPLELRFQFVLVRQGATLLIFLFGYCSHLIIETTRLSQTGDEVTALGLIDEKTVLECSHECML